MVGIKLQFINGLQGELKREKFLNLLQALLFFCQSTIVRQIIEQQYAYPFDLLLTKFIKTHMQHVIFTRDFMINLSRIGITIKTYYGLLFIESIDFAGSKVRF